MAKFYTVDYIEISKHLYDKDKAKKKSQTWIFFFQFLKFNKH